MTLNSEQEKEWMFSNKTHTERQNTVCGQNSEFLVVNLAVHVITTGL
jgi:hypothetical protein